MNKKILIIIFLIVAISVIIVAVSTLIIQKNNQAIASGLSEQNVVVEPALVEETTIPTINSSNDPVVLPTPVLTSGQYYIKINTQMNVITIYTKDDNGKYTIPVKSMICSTGNNTPKNRKYILNGKKWDWKLLFGGVYGQYSTHIDGNILFHSVPYLRPKDHSSLEYWEYDKLGTTCSAGCVRLTVEDAKWIYDNCLYGSTVEFYSSEDLGPLGKPTAMKISDNINCRGWDPTDPITNNPWNDILTY